MLKKIRNFFSSLSEESDPVFVFVPKVFDFVTVPFIHPNAIQLKKIEDWRDPRSKEKTEWLEFFENLPKGACLHELLTDEGVGYNRGQVLHIDRRYMYKPPTFFVENGKITISCTDYVKGHSPKKLRKEFDLAIERIQEGAKGNYREKPFEYFRDARGSGPERNVFTIVDPKIIREVVISWASPVHTTHDIEVFRTEDAYKWMI